VLDATQCISYLTIELKGPIPDSLREPMGDLLYGCDICQEVCPWNVTFARDLPEESPYAPREALARKDARSLARELLEMTQEEFSAAFKGSPMKRAKLRGLKRNAAVVLGNLATRSEQYARAQDAQLLRRMHEQEADEMLREHLAWALARATGETPST